MPYGLNIFDINENFKSLMLYKSEILSFRNGKATMNVRHNDIIVLRSSSSQVALLSVNNGVATFICNTDNCSAIIDLYSEYVPSTNEKYGLRVYNSHGQLTFSSDFNFLTPIRIEDVHINRGTFSIRNENPKFSLGVIMQCFGFTMKIYDNAQSNFRSVMINNDNITFGFVPYTFKSKAKGNGMSYNYNEFYFKAIIVK